MTFTFACHILVFALPRRIGPDVRVGTLHPLVVFVIRNAFEDAVDDIVTLSVIDVHGDVCLGTPLAPPALGEDHLVPAQHVRVRVLIAVLVPLSVAQSSGRRRRRRSVRVGALHPLVVLVI
ncbi:hypothetical protein BV25DRAFT_1825459 [Artomyces pyxidatus]|uniref:Uncharacterized protein n=1 Tax=Artomyces pyxidatus TaxID=48021 RepID=A0ACB8T153_9AGAM|nr:hypothetical protein BV25DRAFT_1825459 [Artomyces pyxidatus]